MNSNTLAHTQQDVFYFLQTDWSGFLVGKGQQWN